MAATKPGTEALSIPGRFTQAAPAIGGLPLQYGRFLLAENLDQKGLRAQREDAPRFQVLTPEVAKVESENDMRLAVNSGRYDVAILLMVRHPGHQRIVTADPRLAEVSAQFSLEVRRQRTRPAELRLQRADCFTDDLFRPGRRRPRERAAYRSSLAGNQRALVQAGSIDSLTDSTKRLQSTLAPSRPR